MKKIVKIKESELVNLIDRIITESTKGVKPKPVVNEGKKSKMSKVDKQVAKDFLGDMVSQAMKDDKYNDRRVYTANIRKRNEKKVDDAFNEIKALIEKQANSLDEFYLDDLKKRLKSFLSTS
jgi:hypothetical protein